MSAGLPPFPPSGRRPSKLSIPLRSRDESKQNGAAGSAASESNSARSSQKSLLQPSGSGASLQGSPPNSIFQTRRRHSTTVMEEDEDDEEEMKTSSERQELVRMVRETKKTKQMQKSIASMHTEIYVSVNCVFNFHSAAATAKSIRLNLGWCSHPPNSVPGLNSNSTLRLQIL
jgi:hypothetical protein